MRSTQMDLSKYFTDKLESNYLKRYDTAFAAFVGKDVKLLELGIKEGASLLLWKDYFPSGIIAGVDIDLPGNWQPAERIHLFKGSQADTAFLTKVAAEIAPEHFDIIIDDASHIGELTKISFWHLFDNHLKPGGIYVIEDWGTGYWDDFPDGKSLNLDSYKTPAPADNSLFRKIARRFGFKKAMPSHSYGMVGLVKQLIDEQAASDVTRSTYNNNSKRKSKFDEMTITTGLVFIKKAAQ